MFQALTILAAVAGIWIGSNLIVAWPLIDLLLQEAGE